MPNTPDIITSELAELRAFTVGLLAELKNHDMLIEKLRHQVVGQNTHRYGSKAEGIDQLQLHLEDEEVAEAAAALAEPSKQVDEDAKTKPRRRPLPEHLPRVEQMLSAGDACTGCGGALRELGRDTTEELEYVPGRFVVNQIIRPRMACKDCECISQAPMASCPIERASPVQGSWRMYWSASMRITYLCIAKRRPSPARVWILIAPHWPDGLASRPHCWSRWPRPSGVTSYRVRPSSRTIRPLRCWHLATARQRRRVPGPMTDMNVRGEAMCHQRHGISLRQTAKAYAPVNTSRIIKRLWFHGWLCRVRRAVTFGQNQRSGLGMPPLKLSTAKQK